MLPLRQLALSVCGGSKPTYSPGLSHLVRPAALTLQLPLQPLIPFRHSPQPASPTDHHDRLQHGHDQRTHHILLLLRPVLLHPLGLCTACQHARQQHAQHHE